MRLWLLGAVAVAVGLMGCGGDEFANSNSGGAGGSAGSGGSSSGGTGGGGTGGSAGSAGAAGGGGAAGVDSGAGGTGGTAALAVVQASPIKLSMLDAAANVSLPSPPSAGNAIIVGITCLGSHQVQGQGDCIIAPGGVTDNQGNTYTLIVQGEVIPSSYQGARGYIFIAENISAPTGAFTVSVDPEVVVVPNVTHLHMAFGAIEVSGLAPAPSLDASDSTPSGAASSTTISTSAAVPNALAVAVLSVRSDDTNLQISAESTWVSHHVHQNNSSGPPGHSLVSRVLTSAGQVSHTWSHDEPTRGATGIIATFKGAAQN